MVNETILTAGLGVLAWAVKKQLDVNGDVRDMKTVLPRVESKVDIIYTHLLGERPDEGRGEPK